jgi:hypothetical protein
MMIRRMGMIALLLVAGCDRSGGGGQPPPNTDPPEVEIPVPAAEPTIAINVQPPTPEYVDVTLEALQELRIPYIRASWWFWSDSTQWAWYPRFKAAGIETLPLVYAYPFAPPDSIGVSMAQRYRDFVNEFGPVPYVQLGNEVDGWAETDPPHPNTPFNLYPGADPCQQGRNWAEQTRIAVKAIRTFDPSVQIVSAGLAWNREGVRDFTRCFVEIAPIDVLAIHIYGDNVYGEPLSRWQVLRVEGWDGPIWTTEIGTSNANTVPFPGMSADEIQANNYLQVISGDENRRGYERIYFFQLTPDDQGFGILSFPDWQPRPAYHVLRSRP